VASELAQAIHKHAGVRVRALQAPAACAAPRSCASGCTPRRSSVGF